MITQFRGLNNVTDPLRLSLEWLVQADNVDVTDSGGLVKRSGYARSLTGTFSALFSTFDFSRMYAVIGNELAAMTSGSAYIPLVTLTSSLQMHWTETNDAVYYNNGTDAGIIQPDNSVHVWRWVPPAVPAVSTISGNLPAGTYQVRCTSTLPDGRTTGTSDSAAITLDGTQALQITGIVPGDNVYVAPADSTVYQLAKANAPSAITWTLSPDSLGVDLTTAFLDPLPLGTDVIQAWKGRVYAAQYMSSDDQTVIWFSEPLAFHLFNLNSNFILVPGHVLMLAPTDDALIIGTESRIYAYSGDKLAQIAEYGTIPGYHWDQDGPNVIFWTVRGVCTALPFTNLTERQVSVAPGVSAGGCLVYDQGRKRYVVAIRQGGEAFNARA